MTAKELCANVKPNIRPQAETLAEAVFALQAKIEQQLPLYVEMPLTQVLTTVQGEQAIKANPHMQEFRATVRDYAAALKNLQVILDENTATAEVSSLDSLRARFKVVS